MTRRTLLSVSAVLAAFSLGLTLDHFAFAAQQQPTIKRTILQRQDDPASSKYEAVMGISEIPPGGTSGKHRHPGIELAYVLDGSVELVHEGKPPITVKAGQATMNIVEKGKPLAEQVP
jgi:quercetin dioxygenase-like cupin family protein